MSGGLTGGHRIGGVAPKLAKWTSAVVIRMPVRSRAARYSYQVSSYRLISKGSLTFLRGVNFLRSKKYYYDLFNTFTLLSEPPFAGFLQVMVACC
jgi:hypothetical protein